MQREWWLISVHGYGDFGFYGTEQEAEEMRAHKAQWEGGAGRKERIPADHSSASSARNRAEREIECRYPVGARELESVGKEPELEVMLDESDTGPGGWLARIHPNNPWDPFDSDADTEEEARKAAAAHFGIKEGARC